MNITEIVNRACESKKTVGEIIDLILQETEKEVSELFYSKSEVFIALAKNFDDVDIIEEKTQYGAGGTLDISHFLVNGQIIYSHGYFEEPRGICWENEYAKYPDYIKMCAD